MNNDFDNRPSRILPGRQILPEPGYAARLAEYQRVEQVKAQILAKSKYAGDGVNIRMLHNGMKLFCDVSTALNAILLGNAELI